MPLRPPAGFIRPGFDPLKNPDAPTAVAASGGDESASVSFTPPANVGGSAISEYYAVSNPGQVTVSGASSPINVTGLTNGTPYTFSVWALNTYGPGPFSAASGSVTPVGPIGVFTTGGSMEQISISSTGNATSFGNLVTSVDRLAGCGSATRGLFAGGGGPSNAIQYITFSSAGNSISFGELTVARSYLQGASNSTRGLFGGGTTASNVNVIDFVTIASTGNATDFGDTTVNHGSNSGDAVASTTRAVFGGGDSALNTKTNVMDFVTIASTGNATDFGDLIQPYSSLAGSSNNTRGIWGGGYPDPFTNVVNYITIASTGNAEDFGDLTSNRAGLATMASSTRCVFACGNESGAGTTNRIDYVTIATTGNATDFGDAINAATDTAGCSSGHGGL
jgi:hypothetical protein